MARRAGVSVRARERSGKLAWAVLLAAIGALVLPAVGRPAARGDGDPGRAPVVTESAAPPVGEEALPARDVIREIDDPHSGEVWLLFRNPSHPGGPGRLVLAAQEARSSARAANHHDQSAEALPVIHAGDALIVEEHTAVVDARLEAIAMSSAAKGAQLKARLKIGGKVVRVVALERGRAVFAPDGEGPR
jgi:hypothetical protein